MKRTTRLIALIVALLLMILGVTIVVTSVKELVNKKAEDGASVRAARRQQKRPLSGSQA